MAQEEWKGRGGEGEKRGEMIDARWVVKRPAFEARCAAFKLPNPEGGAGCLWDITTLRGLRLLLSSSSQPTYYLRKTVNEKFVVLW